MSIETFGVPHDKARFGKDKVENIQGLRGLAILMVLFFHIGVYEGRIFSSKALLGQTLSPGQAGVDLFFVISGFVMILISHGRFHQKGAAATFFLRRAARIYPLYWVYTLVSLPIFLFLPSMINRPEGVGQISLLSSFLLLPSREAPLVGQGWTLVHEMYFYTVFALTFLRAERERERKIAYPVDPGDPCILLAAGWHVAPFGDARSRYESDDA